MKSKRFLVAGMAVGTLLMSGLTLAHHGGNLYDNTQETELKGTITRYEWGTPHNQIYFDVTNEQGETESWVGSTEPAGVMLELGWTRRSLSEGDEVTVFIFAAKNGATVGNLRRIVFPDGTVLDTRRGGSAPPPATP